MRSQRILSAAMGALQLSQVVAISVPASDDSLSLFARDVEKRAPTVDTPVVQIDEPELLNLIEVESDPPSQLGKRAILGQLQLLADTGNRYRITVNGVSIFLHIFYDLAVEYTVIYWTADQTSVPASVSFGLQDPTNGKTISVRSWDHGGRWKWLGAKINDVINVLV